MMRDGSHWPVAAWVWLSSVTLVIACGCVLVLEFVIICCPRIDVRNSTNTADFHRFREVDVLVT